MKRIFSLALAAAVMLFCMSGCAEKKQSPEKAAIRAAALSGPTGMGFARLQQQTEAGETGFSCEITYAGSPDALTGGLISGEIDIAAVPVNLAAVLYNKTEGRILTAAVNTLGVLYVVEKGDTVHSVSDLAGRTVLAAGQGSTPEYIFNEILAQNGVKDEVSVEFVSEHAEALARMSVGSADLILVPEPFVTNTLSKVEGARVALDLTAEWAGVSDSELVQGCLVVQKSFEEEHPETLQAFLVAYAESVDYVNQSPADASVLIEQYGILPSAELAQKAIPNCNIVCITGREMQAMAEDMLSVLFAADPKSVGGQLPGEEMFLIG